MKIPVPANMTATDKMNIIKLLVGLHKVKRFSKAKSEPAFQVFRRHPITRGMASYLFIWPIGNVLQQTISDQEKYDWWKIIRFGLYGALITAPSLYTWVKLTTAIYPNTIFRIACAKVSMTWLETFSATEAWLEVRPKFKPTYMIAITFWPLLATINFAFIPEKQRMLVLSTFAVLWTIYIYCVKNTERDETVLARKTKELAAEQQLAQE